MSHRMLAAYLHWEHHPINQVDTLPISATLARFPSLRRCKASVILPPLSAAKLLYLLPSGGNVPETQTQETIPFEAGDGLMCNLIHVNGPNPPTKGPVLLLHGAGVRANLFRAPVERTIVDHLLDCGYDVWLE